MPAGMDAATATSVPIGVPRFAVGGDSGGVGGWHTRLKHCQVNVRQSVLKLANNRTLMNLHIGLEHMPRQGVLRSLIIGQTAEFEIGSNEVSYSERVRSFLARTYDLTFTMVKPVLSIFLPIERLVWDQLTFIVIRPKPPLIRNGLVLF